MTGTAAEILRARAEAAAARDRIRVTLGRLRQRIDPRVRARETWEDVRERGEEFGDDAIEYAYERPAVVVGATGLGLLLLFRRPLTRLACKLFKRRRTPKWDPKLPRHAAGAVKPTPAREGEKR